MKLRFDRTLVPSLPTVAAAVATLLGLVGAIVTVSRYFDERAKDREETARQHQQDVDLKNRESRQRFDTAFHSAVERLGSGESAIRVGAVASLMTFLTPEYSAFHVPIYELLRSDLKVDQPDDVRRVLVAAFRRLLPLVLHPAAEVLADTDWSRMDLQRLQISEVDISGCDLAFSNLSEATIDHVNMRRFRAFGLVLANARVAQSDLSEGRINRTVAPGCNFSGSTLVSSVLKGAFLDGAQFRGCSLQGAHFDRALMRNVDFTGARLADCFFYEATLDDATLETVTKAERWQDAHWSVNEWLWLLAHTQTDQITDRQLAVALRETSVIEEAYWPVLYVAWRRAAARGHVRASLAIAAELTKIAGARTSRADSLVARATALRHAARYEESAAAANEALHAAADPTLRRLHAAAAHALARALLADDKRTVDPDEMLRQAEEEALQSGDHGLAALVLIDRAQYARINGDGDPTYAREALRLGSGVAPELEIAARIELAKLSDDRHELERAYVELGQAPHPAIWHRYARIELAAILGHLTRARGILRGVQTKAPVPHLAREALREPLVASAHSEISASLEAIAQGSIPDPTEVLPVWQSLASFGTAWPDTTGPEADR